MTTLGGLLYNLRVPVAPRPGYALVRPSWDLYGSDPHHACHITAFCRNPLHPGPCKGWKKHLGLVSPGALHALEKLRHEKLESQRKAKLQALLAQGKKVPAKLLKPIAYDPEGNKDIKAGLADLDLVKKLEPPSAPTKQEIEVKLAGKHAAEKQALKQAIDGNGSNTEILDLLAKHPGEYEGLTPAQKAKVADVIDAKIKLAAPDHVTKAEALKAKLDIPDPVKDAPAAAKAEEAAKALAEHQAAKKALQKQTVKAAGLGHGDVAVIGVPGQPGEHAVVKVSKITGGWNFHDQDGKSIQNGAGNAKHLIRKATPEEAADFNAKHGAAKDAVAAKIVEAQAKAGPPKITSMHEPIGSANAEESHAPSSAILAKHASLTPSALAAMPPEQRIQVKAELAKVATKSPNAAQRQQAADKLAELFPSGMGGYTPTEGHGPKIAAAKAALGDSGTSDAAKLAALKKLSPGDLEGGLTAAERQQARSLLGIGPDDPWEKGLAPSAVTSTEEKKGQVDDILAAKKAAAAKGDATKIDSIAQLGEAQGKANVSLEAVTKVAKMAGLMGVVNSNAKQAALHKQLTDAHATGDWAKVDKTADMLMDPIAHKTKVYTGITLLPQDKEKLVSEMKAAFKGDGSGATPLLDKVKAAWEKKHDSVNSEMLEALGTKDPFGPGDPHDNGTVDMSGIKAHTTADTYLDHAKAVAGGKYDADPLMAANLADLITKEQYENGLTSSQKLDLTDAMHQAHAVGNQVVKDKVNAVMLKLTGDPIDLPEPDPTPPMGSDASLSPNPVGAVLTSGKSNLTMIDQLQKHPDAWEGLTDSQKKEVGGKLYTELEMGAPEVSTLAQNLITKHNIPDPDPTGGAPKAPHVQAASDLANGFKSGTAKQKVAAFDKLTPEEYGALDPNTQKLIQDSLLSAQLKFVDPKKKAQAKAIADKLSVGAGGGAGAGGAGSSTAPEPDYLGDILNTAMNKKTSKEKADAGAEVLAGILEAVGETPGPDFKATHALGLEKMHDNGTAHTFAEVMVPVYAEKVADKLSPSVIAPVFKDQLNKALTADIAHKALQDGQSSPLLDEALKVLKGGVDANGFPSDKAGIAKIQDLLAEHASGGGPLTAPATKATLGKLDAANALAKHAGELEIPISKVGMISGPVSQEKAAEWLSTSTLDNAIVDTGIPGDTLAAVSFDGTEAEAAMKGDYFQAIDNGATVPGGLAGKMPEIIKTVNDGAADIQTNMGWAPDSQALLAWKAASFQALINKELVGKPAGAGGAATPIPASVKEVLDASTSTGGLDSFKKNTIKSAYKSLSGSYLKDNTAQENFDNLMAVATVYSGQIGMPKLTLGEVMAAVDETMANDLGVPDQGLLSAKIKEFLASPGGKKYADNFTLNTSKVSQLTGKVKEELELAEFKKNNKHPVYPGPGAFDPSLQSSDFTKHTNAASLANQKALSAKLGQKFLSKDDPNDPAFKAMVWYTGSGASEMNEYLRHGNGSPQVAVAAKRLEDAMTPQDKPALLLRRTGWEFVPAQYRSLEGIQKLIGGTFHDKAFNSTTVAGQSGSYGKGLQVKLEIEAPAGTRSYHVQHLSQFPKENEVILGSNQTFQVLAAKKGGDHPNQIVIRVRVVTP